MVPIAAMGLRQLNAWRVLALTAQSVVVRELPSRSRVAPRFDIVIERGNAQSRGSFCQKATCTTGLPNLHG